MFRILPLVASFPCLVLMSHPVCAQQKLPTVAEVLDKLREKRDRYGVERYMLEFERTFYDKGKEINTCRWASDFLIDWRTGKFRKSG